MIMEVLHFLPKGGAPEKKQYRKTVLLAKKVREKFRKKKGQYYERDEKGNMQNG